MLELFHPIELDFQDKLLIGQISNGCRQLIFSICARDPLQYSKAARHRETKSLATTSISLIIPENNEFRPSDIRRKIPEELQNIQRSSLANILNHNLKIRKIERVEHFIQKNVRGHPKKYEGKISGPKSYYKMSVIENKINLILSNRHALELIYHYLYENDLLLKLGKWVQLFIYSAIRNYDKETAWKICKSVFPELSNDSEFGQKYDRIKALKEEELERLAEEEAKCLIEKRPIERYMYVFKNGA